MSRVDAVLLAWAVGIAMAIVLFVLARAWRRRPRRSRTPGFSVRFERIHTGDIVLHYDSPLSTADQELVEASMARALRMAQGVEAPS